MNEKTNQIYWFDTEKDKEAYIALKGLKESKDKTFVALGDTPNWDNIHNLIKQNTTAEHHACFNFSSEHSEYKDRVIGEINKVNLATAQLSKENAAYINSIPKGESWLDGNTDLLPKDIRTTYNRFESETEEWYSMRSSGLSWEGDIKDQKEKAEKLYDEFKVKLREHLGIDEAKLTKIIKENPLNEKPYHKLSWAGNWEEKIKVEGRQIDKNGIVQTQTGYDKIKEKHPDAMILFREKDTYTIISQDVEKAKDILNLPVSQRGIMGYNIDAVSFPITERDNYLPKLIRAGQRVVIADMPEKLQKNIDENVLNNQNNKYRVTDNTKNIEVNGEKITLHQIEALRDFSYVKKGDKGGWIQNETNLSHEGNSWVYDNAEVFGNAKVFENAKVYDNARVHDESKVYGNSEVKGAVGTEAEIYGDAKVSGYVFGQAQVYDKAQVEGHLYGNARVFGNAKIQDCAEVYGNAQVYGNAEVQGYAQVFGNAKVHGDQLVKAYTQVGERKLSSKITSFLKNIAGQKEATLDRPGIQSQINNNTLNNSDMAKKKETAKQEEPVKTVKKTEDKPVKKTKTEKKPKAEKTPKKADKAEKEVKATEKQDKAEKKEVQPEKKHREPQMVTVNGDKVSHGHAFQSKTNPEDWFFTARLNGTELKPQKMTAEDVAAYSKKQISIPQLMEHYYPTKIAQKVSPEEYKAGNTLSDGRTVAKMNIYKETDTQREDFGKYKIYAQVGDAKMSRVASKEDLNAYFDRTTTPAQLVEKNFGEKLHLASAYEKFQLPDAAKDAKIIVNKTRDDSRWSISVDMGDKGRTERKPLSYDDGFSLYKAKTATKEQLAAKYLTPEINSLISSTPKQQVNAGIKR